MSRVASVVARVAALTLPVTVRERYYEEWLGDIADCREAGVRASGIAAGAVLFSATLHRNTPDMLGMPLSVAARRHARWGSALLLSSMVFAFGGYLTGGFSPGGWPLLAAQGLWIALTVVGVIVGLAALWRAAALSSPLSKIAATALTTAVLAVCGAVATSTSIVAGILGLLGTVLAIAGTIIGAVAWAGSEGATVSPDTVSTPAVARRRMPSMLTVAVWAMAVLLVVTIPFTSIAAAWLGVFVIPALALCFGALIVVHVRRTAPVAAPRAPLITVALTGALALAAVVVGALDLLIWSPLAQAPGYTLDEIWATLSPADAANGMGFAATWIVFWTIATILYVAGSISILGRASRPSARSIASVGLLLVAGIVFFQFFAGFSMGMSIADTIPPYSGRGSEVRLWYAMAGQLSLVAMLVLSIAPRPLPPRAVSA